MRLKNRSESPELDMNPMVDMAFLLVSFFMLTTTFKTAEAVLVEKPLSSSQMKVPERNIMMITISQEGRVFFGIDNKYTRQNLLQKIGIVQDLEFSKEQTDAFSLLSNMGVPFAQLSEYLGLPEEVQQGFTQTGIPCLGADNELKDWILAARMINPNQRVSILADQNTPYEYVRCVIQTLQELRIYRFQLVTDLENG